MGDQPPAKKRSSRSGVRRAGVQETTVWTANQVHIDQLPPKVLLTVFAFVGPRELLTSVSRVCRRWEQLALSRQLWSRVCLRYEEMTDRPWTPETHPPKDPDGALWLHIEGRKRADELRAILGRVPCLRHLQVSLKESLPEVVDSALDAARRVPVESLALLQVPFRHVHALLKSNAAWLRILEYRQPKNYEKWDYTVEELEPIEPEDEATAARRRQLEMSEMWDSYGRRMHNMARGGRAFWRLVATGVPQLEQLVVDWTWREETDDLFSADARRLVMPRWIKDKGQSHVPDALPSKLTTFRIQAPCLERGVQWQSLWAWPLLAGSAATLRDVSLRLEPCRLQPLLQCRGLRTVRLPLLRGIAEVAANNRLLTSVTLLGDDDGLPYNDLKWDRSFLYASNEEDPNVDPDPTTRDTRTSVQFVKKCADLELPLAFLSLEGFKMSSLEELGHEVGRLAGLTELRLVRSEVQYNVWGALVSAVGKLKRLRRVVVGYASLIPKGMLARLGAALPPACTFLRLDGFGYQDCGRLEAELRAVVAGRAGMHVAVTQPNVSGCRWDQRCELIHDALCDARLLANHGAAPLGPPSWSDQRRKKAAVLQCNLCAQALRFSRSRLEEVPLGEEVPVGGEEVVDDVLGSDSGESWCCEDHSGGGW